LKIATILGARPQFIKAALVSKKIKTIKSLSEVIIHTGQHFDKNMSKIFFDEMGISKPKYNLNINQIEYSMMIDKMIDDICPLLIKEKIDGVLVYGDTNSTLAASVSAKQLDIPVFHVEAGLRSFNRSMHEEKNRIITDHLSSLLFCPTAFAVKNLMDEKILNGVIFSGDVMFDAYTRYSSFNDNFVSKLKISDYILSTIHRRENINSAEKLFTIFNKLDQINLENKIIMPLHPHTKQKIEEYNIKTNITFIEPKGYITMLSLLNQCKMVITDSGGLQKESFFAKKKCLVIREQTEWVELIDQGTNALCKPENINSVYKKILEQESDFSKNFYGEGNSSNIIIQSIENFFS
tara:strand:- start:373 stop:1425 length:1053 start_codon:yes stop_codon:yes gene_type:complete